LNKWEQGKRAKRREEPNKRYTFPFAGITLFRFYGYYLSLSKK
jgi:hypothetical protein